MTLRRCIARTFAVAALAACGTLACSERRVAGGELEAQRWIAQGEAAHFESERRLAEGDVAGARAALESAARQPSPSAAGAADVRAVRQDLFFQLATLELEHGRPEDAVRFASEGLALGTGTDAFTSNLQIARGRALERTGDATGAARDYHAALVISEALLEKSLGHDKAP